MFFKVRIPLVRILASFSILFHWEYTFVPRIQVYLKAISIARANPIIMSIIYLAKKAIGGVFATAAFLARGLSEFTVTAPSDLLVFGKPSNQQIAFDGYSANIEAFIAATSWKQKLFCDQSHYFINADHKITVPLALPRTVFTLKSKPTESGEAKMLAAAADMGIKVEHVGKGTYYTIERPTIEFLAKIKGVAPDTCANFTDYSQLGATMHFYLLVQIVDLFLATNSW
jgi:hypothetical protein